LLLAATAAAYLPSIDGDFLLDDYVTIADSLVAQPFQHSLAAWLKSPRPVAALTFAANYLVSGLHTRGWHVTNVAIHCAAVLLVWLFARVTLVRSGLSRAEGPSLAVAALFALHPLQTESVSYISQRSESLASVGYLGALLLLLARDGAPPARRHSRLALAGLLHALSLLTKPIAATIPVAWLLHAAIVPAPGEERDRAWRRVLRRAPASLPLFALSLWAAARSVAESRGSSHTGYSIPGLPAPDYLATQMRAIPTYLRLIVWPSGQSGDWFFPASRSFSEPVVICGAALLLAVGAAAVLAAALADRVNGDGRSAMRVAAFGFLFFFVALAPSSSFVPLLDPLAEHRVYLAALGPLLAVSAAGALALRRIAPSRAVAAGTAIAVLAAGAAGLATVRRNGVWATAFAFWTDAAAKGPDKARVQLNLAHALYNVRLPDDALAALRRARELSMDGTVSRETVLANIVTTLVALGRVDEARADLLREIAGSPGDSTPLAMLAQVELAARREADSERAALAALSTRPRNTSVPSHAIALKCLGLIRMRRGDLVGALGALRAAAATNAPDPEIYSALAVAEERTGDRAAACRHLARAAVQPGNAFASHEARQTFSQLGCR
jgi:Flp pilus assembly protein TadD